MKTDAFQDIEPDISDELGGYAPEPEPTPAPEPEQKQESPWPDISPLPSLLPEAPEMPEKIIPASFRDYVSDISERMQVAVEVPAVSIIVALSSVVGRSIGIYPKRHDSWIVIPNIWGFVAARSGMLKTPAIEEATKPLGVLAHNARMQHEANTAESQVDEEISSARIGAVKIKITKAAKDEDETELRSLKDELLKLQRQADSEKPIERRYRVNDATTEKLLELLVDNSRGLLVHRDELSGWLRGLDKVGREMDRAFYLESWNGYGSFTTDRIGRGTAHVDGLCLSIFGGIQPAKLAAYVSDALNSTSNDDGLIQRFQLSVYPEVPKVWNLVDRDPDKIARDRAIRVFEILDRYNPAVLGVSLSYSDIPVIHFDDDAQELFNDWLTNLQRRILQGEGSPAFESHLAKYRSLMPSLALLFHLADWANSQMEMALLDIPAVSLQSAKLAASWTEYLELHARKIYAGALNPELQAAHLILQKIEQGKVKNGNSVRDIYRNQWTGLQSKEQVFQGLLLLAECGYLKLVSVKGDEGRPSSDVISINPKFRSDSDGI
jgi:putative DNA primase/helicase